MLASFAVAGALRALCKCEPFWRRRMGFVIEVTAFTNAMEQATRFFECCSFRRKFAITEGTGIARLVVRFEAVVEVSAADVNNEMKGIFVIHEIEEQVDT